MGAEGGICRIAGLRGNIYRDIVYYKILANRFSLVMLYFRTAAAATTVQNNILLIFLDAVFGL